MLVCNRGPDPVSAITVIYPNRLWSVRKARALAKRLHKEGGWDKPSHCDKTDEFMYPEKRRNYPYNRPGSTRMTYHAGTLSIWERSMRDGTGPRTHTGHLRAQKILPHPEVERRHWRILHRIGYSILQWQFETELEVDQSAWLRLVLKPKMCAPLTEQHLSWIRNPKDRLSEIWRTIRGRRTRYLCEILGPHGVMDRLMELLETHGAQFAQRGKLRLERDANHLRARISEWYTQEGTQTVIRDWSTVLVPAYYRDMKVYDTPEEDGDATPTPRNPQSMEVDPARGYLDVYQWNSGWEYFHQDARRILSQLKSVAPPEGQSGNLAFIPLDEIGREVGMPREKCLEILRHLSLMRSVRDSAGEVAAFEEGQEGWRARPEWRDENLIDVCPPGGPDTKFRVGMHLIPPLPWWRRNWLTMLSIILSIIIGGAGIAIGIAAYWLAQRGVAR